MKYVCFFENYEWLDIYVCFFENYELLAYHKFCVKNIFHITLTVNFKE